MLGSVVARRLHEIGAEGDYIVNCIRPDNIGLTFGMAESGPLIQPSTDAISEDSEYARTKRIIELAPCVVIRCGIVDITRQPEMGYRNWLCNPLTPLEWIDYAWERRDQPGLHVTGRETVSRYEVARLVAEVFDRPLPHPAWHPIHLNRVQPRDDYPPLRDALIEYRDWL